MITPLVATKLFIPPPRSQAVARGRLVERLDAGLQCKVTLISAPAGFGKTTLVSTWVATSGASGELPVRRVAWLSLDEGDSDPIRFLSYLVAALRTVAPTLGEGLMAALQSPQPPPTEFMLAALLNEIAALPEPFILVLDDYHLIDAQAVDAALAFVVDHLPPHMHLVITTREDPQLPLARLRARGQLTEVRAADLRFTPMEAAAFLNQAMGLALSADEVAALEERTEGWVAGLQLAALSLQDEPDASAFIRAFAGDHRYIVDYLVEEVLQRQPEAVRTFLLQTAILDQLSGPLCEAVTGQQQGQARLEALARGNFLIVPLDDKRRWYRYHHLFADVLQAHLRAEQPDLLPLLHQRAGAWYEQQGATPQAIRHALAAADFVHVAELLEQAIPAMGRSREGSTFLGWLKALPNEIISVRPVLCVGYAWASMAGGELDAVEPWLEQAEQWLEMVAATHARPAAMVVTNEEEFRRLPGMIAIYRAGVAQILGNFTDTIQYARRVLAIVPEDDHLGRGAGTALLGLALWASGDLETAYQTYAEGMARVQQAGNIADVINSANPLVGIRAAQGRLAAAMSIYEQSLRFATEQGESYLQATADHYVGMSEIRYEQNDLAAATQYLLRSKELSERSSLPHNRAGWCAAMARIAAAQGDLAGALGLVEQAERLYVRDFFPTLRPIAALKTRVWLAQGRLGEALEWARAQGLTAQDDLSYLREFEHITLARVLLAQSTGASGDRALPDALGLLDRLLHAAQAGGRMGSEIEILALQALAQQMQGDIAAGLASLERALTLAEPEGYVRLFVDEGPPMAQLLRAAAQRGIHLAYTAKLLAAWAGEQPRRAEGSPLPTAPAAQPGVEPLAEPLSERELEVLYLFQTELSGPEIALELVIALSTLRTHTKSIYGKLNVNSRRAAVKRAAELGLI